jgi:glucose/arabinose dehydrogenase
VPTRASLFLATAIALGVALAGCGSTTATTGSDQSGAATAAASASPAEQPGQGVLTAAQAKAALPTAADLPSGWTVKAISADATAATGDVNSVVGKITYKPAACQAFYDKLSANDAVTKAAQATKAAAVASPASGYSTTVAFSISSYKSTDDSEQPLKAVSDFGAPTRMRSRS